MTNEQATTLAGYAECAAEGSILITRIEFDLCVEAPALTITAQQTIQGVTRETMDSYDGFGRLIRSVVLNSTDDEINRSFDAYR